MTVMEWTKNKIKTGAKYVVIAYAVGVAASYLAKDYSLLKEENALLTKQNGMCDERETKEYETLDFKIKQIKDDGKTLNILWSHSLPWPYTLGKSAWETGKKLL